MHDAIAAAPSVLVIGGGPTGVEVVGEVATEFPTKPLTIVQSGDRLLPDLSPKMSAAALKWFQGRDNVKVGRGRRTAPACAAWRYWASMA